MKKTIYQKMLVLGKTVNLQILFGLYIVMAGFIMPAAERDIKQYSGGNTVIDLHFSYTPEKAYELLDSYGPDGRKYYFFAEATADTVYVLIYAMFFLSLLIWLYQNKIHREERLKIILALPVAALCFDFLENICVLTLLTRFPERLDQVASLSAVFTGGKWLFALLTLTAIVAGVIWSLVRIVRQYILAREA